MVHWHDTGSVALVPGKTKLVNRARAEGVEVTNDHIAETKLAGGAESGDGRTTESKRIRKRLVLVEVRDEHAVRIREAVIATNRELITIEAITSH